jgi:hypothetical protein
MTRTMTIVALAIHKHKGRLSLSLCLDKALDLLEDFLEIVSDKESNQTFIHGLIKAQQGPCQILK